MINRKILNQTAVYRKVEDDSWSENSNYVDTTLNNIRYIIKDNLTQDAASLKEMVPSTLFFDPSFSTPADVEFELNSLIIFENSKIMTIKGITHSEKPDGQSFIKLEMV